MNAPSHLEYYQLFNTRREYFRLLLNLSRKQSVCVQDEQYHELLELLGQKQRILGCLDELGKRQSHQIQNWPIVREQIPLDTRKACDEILAETETLLAELISEESSSTSHLTTRRDQTRRQLLAVSQGGRVHAAYNDSLEVPEFSPIHLDVNQ
ncbi:MAG: hypothetical protein ACKVT0_08015 [Planctomycetaceae bacterium]